MVNHMVNYLQLDSVFSALADPTRRGVLERLSHGEATITELAQPYDKSLPAFLKHVRVLEKAGLVKRRKDGRTNYLCLQPDPLQNAHDWLAEHREMWEVQFDNLAQYLDATDDSPEPTPQDDEDNSDADITP